MADKIFDALKANAKKRQGLDQTITIKVSANELEILTKKAEVLDLDIEDLLREYVLGTAAFDNSPFEEKKAKKVVKKATEKVGES